MKAFGLYCCLFSGVLFASSPAFARKFDFKSESMAAYLRGTYGLSQVGDSAFATSSGNGITFDQKVRANASGEFGLVFSAAKFNIRLGAELLLPRELSELKGVDSGGTKMFDLDSSIMALIPMANIELFPVSTPTSKVILGFGGGMGFVTVDNKYKMTSAGASAFSGIVDHTESSAARIPVFQVYAGYEVLFTDTVTFTIDAGYRHAPVRVLKSTKDTTTFTGNQTTGTDLVNMDGGNRTIDLSGPFAGIAFRFYIGL